MKKKPVRDVSRKSTVRGRKKEAVKVRKSETASYNPAPDAAAATAPTGRYWEFKVTG
jgi:hypothetical protein